MEIADFQGWGLLIVNPLLASPPPPATLVSHGVGAAHQSHWIRVPPPGTYYSQGRGAGST